MKKILGIFLLISLLTTAQTTVEETGSTTNNKNETIIPEETIPIIPKPVPKPDGSGTQIVVPMIPLEPAMPIKKDLDEEGRKIEKNFRILMDERVNVYIPLEVITDIDMEATVIDNEIVRLPFEIELNRKPEKQNYYKIKYSETAFDIDGDGKIDTFIFSPPYINERKETNNYVEIQGANISKEGKHNKTVYITIEVGNEENKIGE